MGMTVGLRRSLVSLAISLAGLGAAATEPAARGIVRWDFPRLGN